MDPVYAPPRRARASRDEYRRVTPEDDQAMQAVSAALYQPPSTHHPNVPPNDQLAAYTDGADAHRVYAGKRMREGGEMVGDDDAGVFKASGSLTRVRGGGYGSAPPHGIGEGDADEEVVELDGQGDGEEEVEEDGDEVAAKRMKNAARMLYSMKESIARQPAQRCGVDGCEFQTKQKSNLKRHQALKHGIGDVDAEELRRKQREWHARHVHGIGNVKVAEKLRRKQRERMARHTVQRCGVDGCEYQNKDKSNLKRHQVLKHGIGDVDAEELRRKMREYEAGRPAQRCGVDGCDYQTTNKRDLKNHQARVHGIRDMKGQGRRVK